MSCEHVSDRDVNGARNILLRYLTLNEIQVPDEIACVSFKRGTSTIITTSSTFATTGLDSRTDGNEASVSPSLLQNKSCI